MGVPSFPVKYRVTIPRLVCFVKYCLTHPPFRGKVGIIYESQVKMWKTSKKSQNSSLLRAPSPLALRRGAALAAHRGARGRAAAGAGRSVYRHQRCLRDRAGHGGPRRYLYAVRPGRAGSADAAGGPGHIFGQHGAGHCGRAAHQFPRPQPGAGGPQRGKFRGHGPLWP